jgi:hypothetical protein
MGCVSLRQDASCRIDRLNFWEPRFTFLRQPPQGLTAIKGLSDQALSSRHWRVIDRYRLEAALAPHAGNPVRGHVQGTTAIGTAFGAIESLAENLAIEIGAAGVRAVCLRTTANTDSRTIQETMDTFARATNLAKDQMIPHSGIEFREGRGQGFRHRESSRSPRI